MARYRIGTSGYSYKQWKGHFYPEDLDDKEMLRFYAERLDTVEINNTFYRFATVRQLQSWAKDVGDDFAFSLKAPRRITHELRLRDAAELANDFLANATALGDKLGCVLFQLPPFLKCDLPRLEDFLHQLTPGFRTVFEFRSASWYVPDVFDCLRRFGAAPCVTDGGEDDSDGDVPAAGADFGYFRLRRDTYDEPALAAAAEMIRQRTQSMSDVFVYLKHEDEGPAYAQRLRELLA